MKIIEAGDLRVGNIVRRPGEPDREVIRTITWSSPSWGDQLCVTWRYAKPESTTWLNMEQPVVVVEGYSDGLDEPDIDLEEIPFWLLEGVGQ